MARAPKRASSRPCEWDNDWMTMDEREYTSPRLEEFGSVADLTQVGPRSAGGDILPGQSNGNDGGSVMPPGLQRRG